MTYEAKPFPIGDAVSMLLEQSTPNFSWMFTGQNRNAASKFRKALSTEIGRRKATDPMAENLTTILASAIISDQVVFFVVLTWNNEVNMDYLREYLYE